MRSKSIYYIFEYNPNMSGVNRKITSKIIGLRELGIPIKGLLIYSNENEDLLEYSDVIFEKIFYNPDRKNNKIFNNRFLSFITVYLKERKYYKFLGEILKKRNFSLIIKRYGNLDVNSYRFVHKIKGRVIYELNTIQYNQNKKEWNYRGFFKSSTWVSYILFSELYFGKKCLAKAKAIIAVTNEISANTINRVGKENQGKIHVISNGVRVGQVAPYSPIFDEELNMLMIRGVDSDWHGLDIIFKSMKNTNKKIKIYIVGDVLKEEENSNIVYTGRLNTDEITKLIERKNIHIGLGSMALIKAGLKEASPLKVRDYLSRGLPVVLNYYDTDISKDSSFMREYCFSFNDEMNLDTIYDWFKDLYFNKNDYSTEIQSWALKNIDIAGKIKEYSEIINKSLPK